MNKCPSLSVCIQLVCTNTILCVCVFCLEMWYYVDRISVIHCNGRLCCWFPHLVALGTLGASTKRKLTCELSPLCSLGGAEHIRTMHVVNKSKIAKSLIGLCVCRLSHYVDRCSGYVHPVPVSSCCAVDFVWSHFLLYIALSLVQTEITAHCIYRHYWVLPAELKSFTWRTVSSYNVERQVPNIEW